MTINLNNSATDKIPPSDKICPLVQWILMSTAFIIFALFEYFLILIVLRFWDKVGSNIQIFKYSNIQIFKYSNIQMFKYPNIQIIIPKYQSIESNNANSWMHWYHNFKTLYLKHILKTLEELKTRKITKESHVILTFEAHQSSWINI